MTETVSREPTSRDLSPNGGIELLQRIENAGALLLSLFAKSFPLVPCALIAQTDEKDSSERAAHLGTGAHTLLVWRLNHIYLSLSISNADTFTETHTTPIPVFTGQHGRMLLLLRYNSRMKLLYTKSYPPAKVACNRSSVCDLFGVWFQTKNLWAWIVMILLI